MGCGLDASTSSAPKLRRTSPWVRSKSGMRKLAWVRGRARVRVRVRVYQVVSAAELGVRRRRDAVEMVGRLRRGSGGIGLCLAGAQPYAQGGCAPAHPTRLGRRCRGTTGPACLRQAQRTDAPRRSASRLAAAARKSPVWWRSATAPACLCTLGEGAPCDHGELGLRVRVRVSSMTVRATRLRSAPCSAGSTRRNVGPALPAQ